MNPSQKNGPLPTLEAALEALESDADTAMKALANAIKTAKRVKTAAAYGQTRELALALEAAAVTAAQAADTVEELRQGWRFDVAGYFTSGGYTKELLASAAEAGVAAFESDERILSYPVIVEVLPDATVVVDKKKDRRVRPSVVVAHLESLQQRPPKFKAEAFIESLAAGYDLVVAAKGLRTSSAARLVDVHRVLTLLPGAARDYTRQELARDIYLLDQSGVVDTKDARRMTLPASALTRSGGTLTTVTKSGQTKVYAGVAFAGTATFK